MLFDGRSFDVVYCQFGVMVFPDKIAGYREALRTLKPEGRFIFNVWDRIEHNEFADVATRSSAELRAAGFGNIAIHTVTQESRAASPIHPAIAHCKGTPLRNEIEIRNADALDEITEKAAAAIAKRFGSGSVVGKIQGHVIVAGC